MINKLLVINIAVYLILAVTGVIMSMMQMDFLYNLLAQKYLGMPAGISSLITKIWTPLTYMFVHFEFWHLLGNMLWLFCMGRIFMTCFNNKQTLGVYILGGLSGALLYLLVYNIIPVFFAVRDYSVCVGASAAVTALVIATCVNSPNMEIRIFGILPLTLKWLGIIYIVYDVLQLTGSNAGGHITHLGGAVFGYLFAVMIRKGKDLTSGVNNIIDKIVTLIPSRKAKGRKAKMHVSYKNTETRTASEMSDEEFNMQKASDQQRIDEILDKISQSGYNNLTKEEKEFLFKMSKK